MRGYKLNCEVKNEFIRTCLLVTPMKGKILDKELTLWLAVLIIPFRCSVSLTLLSYLTPSSFSQVVFLIIAVIFSNIDYFNTIMPRVHKMVKHSFEILQQMG